MPCNVDERCGSAAQESDADGSGYLTWAEFAAMRKDERLLLILSEMNSMTLEDFFGRLDVDGEGTISIAEFVHPAPQLPRGEHW